MCVREANLICSFAIGHLSLRSGASPWVECWFDSEPEPRARYAVGVRMNLSRMSPSRPGRTFDKVQLSAYYWIRIRDHDHPAAMAQVIHITLTAETDHPISAGPSHRSLGSTESFHRKVWKAKTVVLGVNISKPASTPYHSPETSTTILTSGFRYQSEPIFLDAVIRPRSVNSL
ncbi:hypothetical protein F5J12DRAFT_474353 [Pisolithus orientalis]|uniref:uncharacterized protein n=1 Tax=Pisolithus orientalis TaxID=936130 RepID=UPI002224361B|nr:uncharacterized protein F5J12DRAFT_474353 [Pisolithus orientalis]KAI5990876.1 hypothetical protein F5J12DRAFT_474353 [Pisolithus orientalis]